MSKTNNKGGNSVRRPNYINPPNIANPLSRFVKDIEKLHSFRDEILQIEELNDNKKRKIVLQIIGCGGGVLTLLPHLNDYINDIELRKFLANPIHNIVETIRNKHDRETIYIILKLGVASKGMLINKFGFDKNTARNCLQRLNDRGITTKVAKDIELLLKFKQWLRLTDHNFKMTDFYELSEVKLIFSVLTKNIQNPLDMKVLDYQKKIDSYSIEEIKKEEKGKRKVKKGRDGMIILSTSAKRGYKKMCEFIKRKGENKVYTRRAEQLLGINSSSILRELMEKEFISGYKSSGAIFYSYFKIKEKSGFNKRNGHG